MRIRNLCTIILDIAKINLKDWKIFIPLAIILSIGLNIIIAKLFEVPLHAGGEVLWFALTTSGFLNPIYEEFLFRGFLLGVLTLLVDKVTIQFKKPNLVKYGGYLVALLVTNLIFVASHSTPDLYSYVARFLSSTLFGLLYLKFDKNLLPSIIAHSAGNTFLILLDASRGIY